MNKSLLIMFLLHKFLTINFSQFKSILIEKSSPNETSQIINNLF